MTCPRPHGHLALSRVLSPQGSSCSQQPPEAPPPLLRSSRSSRGHCCLSLSRANSPQLFQLFLSNSIYNKLCLNFCLSDNNNNTIIIWSITYSQLYLIKAVISLRVSGNRVNRKSCTTRTSQWGLRLNRSGVTGAEAPEARGHQQGPASGVWVLPPWSHAEGGSAAASGQRRSLEPLRTRAQIPSDLGRLTGRLFLSRLWNRGLGSGEGRTQEQGGGLGRPAALGAGRRGGPVPAEGGRAAWVRQHHFAYCVSCAWHCAGLWG